MLSECDYEEAYNLLMSISDAEREITHDQHGSDTRRKLPPSFIVYDYRLQYVIISKEERGDNKIKFNMNNKMSFIRGYMHRKADVNIYFGCCATDRVRIGQEIIHDYNFSEASLFQQSLVLDFSVYKDLEFLHYLKGKGFPHDAVLYREAFSIEGLRQIHSMMQEVLCLPPSIQTE